MKKNLMLFILASGFVLLQSCEPKKAKEENVTTLTPVVESKTVATKEEKREAVERSRLSKIETRKAILEERLKKGLYFTDANNKLVYWKAETQPSYPGGDEEMTKYLNNTIAYPQEAKDRGDEGTVFVDFVVTETGKVREVMVNEESSENENSDLREEAIRVVRSMPLWKPGRQQGKAVQVAFNLPITFRLE